MHERRLLITADDLGCSAQRSHGIFQCREFGVVTGAVLWPNGQDSERAAKHARERGLPAGLQLNLCEEYPLSKQADVATLVNANGQFHEWERLFTLLDEGAVDAEHLAREVRAQLEWMYDQGVTPTHVAGNWDCHVHPAVAQALLPLLERYGIRFVRIPCEEPLPPFGFEVPEAQLSAIRRVNARAAAARTTFAAAGIASTDHFRGHSLLGNASLKNLRHILSRLPEGTTELMVHPGSQTAYGTPFDLDPQRQTELRMLLDESIPALLREKKIALCSFADL